MPDKKLPISEFAAKIKSKYPQYGNLSDTDLVTKITNTYPKYKDMVDLSGISKKKELSEPVSPVGGETGISVPPSGFEELKPAKRQPTEVIKEPKVVGEDTLLARKMERAQRPAVATTEVKLPAAPKVVAEEKAAERALAPKLPTAPKEDIGELEGLSNAIDRGILQGKLADMLALGQMPKREDIKEIARINKELTQIPSTGAYQRFNAAPDLKTAAKEFVDNPFEITSQLISESLSALVRHGYSRALAGAGTGAALGSLIPIPGVSTAAGAGTGYIAGMGVAGYNLEMASSIMDSFREAGVDVTDEKSLTKAFDDPNTLRKAREFANKRAVPIAIFDMFSAGMGGKLLGKPAKTILSKVGRGAAEVGIQMGMAGAGETAAQLTAGQKINPTAILAEVIGEAGGGAPDIIVGTMIENKKNNQSIRKEAVRLDIEPQQLQDMLDISEASGEITDAQANEIKKEYEDIQKVKQAVPEEFKKNADVIEALEQKRQLEAKKQGLDPVFAKKIDEQIKALDTKIDDIVAAGEVAPEMVQYTMEAPRLAGEPEQISKPIELSIEPAPQVPAAKEKTYRVEYFDPESRKMTHQMFATEAEGEAFKKTLTREQASQGVTSYFEKAPAKGVGEVALEAAPSYLQNVRQTEAEGFYKADFGRNGGLTWEIPESQKEKDSPEYLIIQSIDRNKDTGEAPKEDSKGEGAKAIADLFNKYPSVNEIVYDDYSQSGFWQKIGGDNQSLKRKDFFKYYNSKFPKEAAPEVPAAPAEEEVSDRKFWDEYGKSDYSYGRYGGKSSDTLYITDTKSGKVVKEIKIKNKDFEGAKKEVFKWIDSKSGTKILEAYEEVYGEPELPAAPEKTEEINVQDLRKNPNIKLDFTIGYPESFVSLGTDRETIARENNIDASSIRVGDEVVLNNKKYVVKSFPFPEKVSLIQIDENGKLLRNRDLKEGEIEEPEVPAAPVEALKDIKSTSKALEEKFNPEYKNSIVEKLSSFDDQIKNKKFPNVLEVAEKTLPRDIFNKYKSLYEIGARNNITVSNETLPAGLVAAWAFNNVQLNKNSSKYYLKDYNEFAETLNHEIIHGLISRGVRNQYALYNDLQSVIDLVVNNFDSASDNVKEIIGYIQDTRKEFTEKDIIGATDEELASGKYRETGSLEELITYAFTDSEFAKFLDSIPASKEIKTKGNTIFEQLKNIVRSIIGGLVKSPTALDEINSVLDDYFDTSWNESQIAERNKTYQWGLKFKADDSFFDKYENDPQVISREYHKAKADGSNPEFVKAVEGLFVGEVAAAPEVPAAPKPTEKVSAVDKRTEAKNQLRDAFNDLMNLGVAYDPRSQAEKQVRLTKAIINVIKQEAIGAIKDLQKYIKDNIGFDISDVDAKYLLIESKKPEYAIQEPTAGKVPVQPKARAGEKVEAGVPPARPPKAPKEEGEAEGRKEERRFSKTLIESPELLKAVKKGVGATLEYTRQANAMSVAQAQEILDVLGEDKAYNAIKDEQTNGAVRTVLGQVLIKRYNELAKKATSKDDRDSYINNTIDIAEYVTKKLATDAGQTIQAFKLWQALTPEAQLLAAVKEVKKSARANVGKVRKDIDNLGKKFNKANEEAIKEILKSEEVDRSVKKDAQEGVQKAKDRAAKARQKRADIIKKYKGKGGITLTTGGLTKEGIEFVGEVAVTYIEEGLAEVQVIAEKILADIKTITGSSPNDKVKQEVFEIAEKELSKSDLKIVKSVKDQRLKINEIAIKHFTEAEKIKKNLAQKFMDEADMSESNAEALAKRFEDAFDRVVSRKKAEILAKSKKRFDRIQKAINEQAGKKAENKTLQDEIIKYSNLGAFKADDMLDYLAKKFNLGQLTTEQAAKIEELAQKIQKAPEGTPKREATEDLLAYQANLNKGNWGEVAQAIWYANILSGYRTHEKNIVSTFFNSLAELGTEIIADPKSAPYLIAGYIEGFRKRGLLEAGRTLATGRSPIHVSKIETPEPLERIKFIRGGYNPANWFKYVGRAMKAEDVLSFQGLKEARAWQLARKEAEKYGFNTWTKSGWKKVNELLMNTTERFEIARDQALEEGLVENSRDYKRRIYELMENSRPEAMTEDAYNFAAHGTYNYMSDGTLGAFTNAISNALDVKIGGVQPGRFVVPFTRIITNVVNNALDYSPVGVIRAAKGARGFKSFDEFSLTKGSYKPLTPEQRRIVAIKAAVGISFAAIIQYMVSAGLIDMSGEGPEDEKKKAQLREQGWQPYSIKIGDTWYSYFYTPLVLTLGWMGNLNDAAKYGEEDEQTLLRRASIASLKFGGMIADMTWINSAATFLGALNEPKINEQQRRVENALSGMARGFVPFAQNITQLTQAYNSTFQIPAKQVNNSWEALYQDIPIVRNSLNDKVNALGEPVIKDIDIMWSKEKGSPVWSFLTNKKGWVATLNRKTVLVFDQKLRQDRPLTDDEFYELSKLRGRYIKEDIERIMKDGYPVKREGAIKIVLGEDMTPKELNNILSKRIEPLATKKAKAKIFGFEYSEKEADELNAELTELEREYWGLNEN